MSISQLEWFQQAFPPLAVDTFETIIGRMVADATAGIDPTDATYPDVIVGSIANDLFATTAIEIDRLRDFAANEVPRAGVPTLAQGPYLDSWAEAFALPNGTGGTGRKDASAATGQVTFTGDAGTVIDTNVEIATVATTPDADPIVFRTTVGGVIDSSLGGSPVEQGVAVLPVVAEVTGAATNVLANTITVLQTALDGVASVANTQPTQGGADVESDTALQTRVGAALAGSDGSGTISDYERWLLGELAVGYVTVAPCWAGPTTVGVWVTDTNNNPFTDPTFVQALQDKYDPTPGQGHGIAPIGHFVTIATPSGVGVAVYATVEFEDGFSYDGTNGTRGIRSGIEAALTAYFAGLDAGEPVVWFAVAAAIMDVVGVANLVSLEFSYETVLTLATATGDMQLTVANAAGFETGNAITVGGASVTAATVASTPDALHIDLPAAIGVVHAISDPVSGPQFSADAAIPVSNIAVLNAVTLS